MKKALFTLLLVAQCSMFNVQCSMAQVGTWRNYLAYHDVQNICKAGDNLFVLASNGLYQYNLSDHSITTFDRTNGLSDSNITHIAWNPQAKRLITVYQNSNIDLIDPDGNITNISALYTKVITGDKAVSRITIDGQYAWLVCGFGLVKVDMQRAEISDTYTPSHPDYPTTLPDYDEHQDYGQYIGEVSQLQPDGPARNDFGFLRWQSGRLYGVNNKWDAAAPGGIQVYDGARWEVYPSEGISEQTGVNYVDLLCVDSDPRDASHVVAGGRNGLYEFRNGQLAAFYNHTNSPIEPYDGQNKEYELVTGVKFDAQGTLWLLNSQAPSSSLLSMENGQFTKHNHDALMKLDDGGISGKSNGWMKNMMIDSHGLLWFVNDHWRAPALYLYDMQNDRLTAFETFVNQNGQTVENIYAVTCAAEDRDGNIWVGTDAALLMLKASDTDDASAPFQQIVVPRNDGSGLGDYLFDNVSITAIAIDAANRKWIATNGNGVYLVSADNMQQLQHFTTENSPLLTDYVTSITLQPQTGEVFFGSSRGLCSYMADAVAPADEMSTDNIRAFPNPVPPGFTGMIVVTGMTYDADVKIVNAAGRLIAEGRSNGGMFTWNGCDQQGRRVASGVYTALIATREGKKGATCRIAVIR